MNPDLSAFIDAIVSDARPRAGRIRVQDANLARAIGINAGAETDFCSLWPTIKVGLELLKNIVPPWAKWLIDAVIAIGDRLCG